MTRTRRWSLLLAAMAGVALLGAQPAMACGGLVGPGGTVQLARTTTLAGYHDGVEHYLTSFTYAGGGAKFGSIVPLPGVPTDVRKGGEWTLQRLVRETQPQPEALRAATFTADSSQAAEELLTTRVDALDITVLRGGGRAVGDWAREHGFGLSVDAPEVLDFYAARPRVHGRQLRRRGPAPRPASRDGTTIHLTYPPKTRGCLRSPESDTSTDPIQATVTAHRPAPRCAAPRGPGAGRHGPERAGIARSW